MAKLFYEQNLGLANSASWATSANGPTGVTVATGDECVFHKLDGTITADLTHFETEVPAKITVMPTCRLNTPSGSRMSIGDGTNACDIDYMGSGSRFGFESVGATNSVGTARFNPLAGAVTMHSDEGGIDTLECISGRCFVSGSVYPDIVYNFGADVQILGSGTLAELLGNRGSVTSEANITTANMLSPLSALYLVKNAGVTTLTVNDSTVFFRSAGTSTTVNFNGGTITPQGSANTHKITTLNARGTNRTTRYIKTVGLSSLDVTVENLVGTVTAQSKDAQSTASSGGSGDTDFGAGA